MERKQAVRIGHDIGLSFGRRSISAALPGKDGPTGAVYLPYTAASWTAIASGVLAPDHLFPCQETSGNLVDSVTGGVLTARTGAAYQQTVLGWTTKFAGVTGETVGSGFWSTSGSLWNAGSESLFAVMYAAVTGSGGNRCLLALGGASAAVHLRVVAAGQAGPFIGASATIGTFVYENPTATVYPFVFQWDRRGSNARMVTNQETVQMAYASQTDGDKGIGATGVATPTCRFCLLSVWRGAKAEAMFDRGGAGLGGATLISNLGW